MDNLKKEAKRWLRALRSNQQDARARLLRAYADAPAEPSLRSVQHALAREHGHESWTTLKGALKRRQAHDALAAVTGGRTHAERVATFLEFACWDHHTHGKGDHRMHDHAAGRLLAQHPEIGRDSIYTAVVCGLRDEVERRLTERPEAARAPGGARGWTPLLYLCYTRFSHQPTIENAVPIARLLLDGGANPNDCYMAGASRYTALVGVAAEGEQNAPRQPQGEPLFQLLLERGAEPFDIQVLYNTHFSGDLLWWLELINAHTLKTGRATEWADPTWSMLGMGGYGPGAYYVLKVALEHNDLRLAEWALSHGAGPDVNTSTHPKFKPTRTLYEDAVRGGLTDMADLLLRFGATPRTPVMSDEDAFVAACLRLDRDDVRSRLGKHPEYQRSPNAIFAAARKDRADVVAFLLDLGVPIEIEDQHRQRALHEAAARNALRVAALLVERGAEIDPRETGYNATPIGYAAYGDHHQMVEFLSRVSRDVWALASRGYVDRLREVLHAEPALARVVAKDGSTPLWWLPEDEETALEIVELFLSWGADPSARNNGGGTAADWALTRGMLEVAVRLVAHVSPASPPASSGLQRYESLARDLVIAYETGQAGAMERLQEHHQRCGTWEELRAMVRQRLDMIPESERPAGYFALLHAKLLIAREAGFESWEACARALGGGS